MFQVDYELAMINAIKLEFPSAEIRTCLFHFAQCIWRNVQKNGLADKYIGSFRTLVTRLTGLALVPLEHIDSTFGYAMSSYTDALIPDAVPANLQVFISYFEETWFDDGSSLFDRSLWNHFLNTGRTTNNNLEVTFITVA